MLTTWINHHLVFMSKMLQDTRQDLKQMTKNNSQTTVSIEHNLKLTEMLLRALHNRKLEIGE